ncbi:hypothetical protein FM042_07080 [Aliidiomarina halalkaliphila]|uniref:Uncharacterized protein n=1 Tax=Aliidiomarina halalkaliphila TaxID=2593535 RepID=A0A552X118_9GAMM|nr:hypothetical protein [Aliidiomarina halalkaliphila]TRW48740.1 hypothetical protein FM042_07080 [Aliidiomarina halalkaliphila]
MPFEIKQLSWHKRRRPTEVPQPVDIQVDDFRQEVNHACEVTVTFDNGEVLQMHGRVIQNPITGVWSVTAINGTGQSVLARYVGV